MTFTETNDGVWPIEIVAGSPDFRVSQNGTTLVRPLDFSSPDIELGPTAWSILQPGQSYSRTETWNGLPTTLQGSSLTAPVTISNDLDPDADAATIQDVALSTDVLTTSVTTDKTVYQLGEPIH